MTCTVLLAVFTLGSCNGLAGNDEMDRYFQRSDSITLSAGDAKQVNAVTGEGSFQLQTAFFYQLAEALLKMPVV